MLNSYSLVFRALMQLSYRIPKKKTHMEALMYVRNTHASFDIIQQHVMSIAKQCLRLFRAIHKLPGKSITFLHNLERSLVFINLLKIINYIIIINLLKIIIIIIISQEKDILPVSLSPANACSSTTGLQNPDLSH